LIFVQRGGAAGLLATAAGQDQHFCQSCHIPQTKVQALPCNRVDAMRRIAHQRQAGRSEPFRQRQRQGIGEPLTGQRDPAQEIAKPGAQRLQILGIRQGLNRGSRFVRLAPHDAGVVAALQRQDRQGTGRHEELLCNAPVIVLVPDRGDQRGLAITPTDPPDPGPRSNPRSAPVAADQKPSGQRPPRGQRYSHTRRPDLLRDSGFAGQKRDPGRGLHRLQKCCI
jgi:hypothetical protein